LGVPFKDETALLKTMKRFALISLGLLMAAFLRGQVPLLVQDSFAVAYPDVLTPEWTTHSLADHQATFVQNGTTLLAVFDTGGRCIALGERIPLEDVPEVVRETLGKQVNAKCLVHIERVHYANGKTLYRFHLNRKGREEILEVDEIGEMMGLGGEGQE
jgi:hypothetical protein